MMGEVALRLCFNFPSSTLQERGFTCKGGDHLLRRGGRGLALEKTKDTSRGEVRIRDKSSTLIDSS